MPLKAKKMFLGGVFSKYEQSSPQFNADKSKTNGKIFILDSDITGDGHINIDDLQWDYLDGDGDFKSDEVTALRDEADIIITNPPFSLFRDFLAWITEADKQFIIIGNINAITYKETFPLIMTDKMWMGSTIHSGDREFEVPQEYPLNYKIPCSGVISRPAASTSCRSFFITSAGIHLRSTLTVRTRLRLRTMSIGA